MSACDEIIRRARAGERPGEIAIALNLAPNTVYCHLSRARRAGLDVPRYGGGIRAGVTMHVPVPPPLRVRLAAEAKARGQTSNDLAVRILSAVLEDGLTDAVLDDDTPRNGESE